MFQSTYTVRGRSAESEARHEQGEGGNHQEDTSARDGLVITALGRSVSDHLPNYETLVEECSVGICHEVVLTGSVLLISISQIPRHVEEQCTEGPCSDDVQGQCDDREVFGENVYSLEIELQDHDDS